MDLGSFLLMRQELVLLFVILVLVILEIFINNKKTLVNGAIVLFAMHTLTGFIPLSEGELFGGMFKTSPLIHMFKNVLNVGVLIRISATTLNVNTINDATCMMTREKVGHLLSG